MEGRRAESIHHVRKSGGKKSRRAQLETWLIVFNNGGDVFRCARYQTIRVQAVAHLYTHRAKAHINLLKLIASHTIYSVIISLLFTPGEPLTHIKRWVLLQRPTRSARSTDSANINFGDDSPKLILLSLPKESVGWQYRKATNN